MKNTSRKFIDSIVQTSSKWPNWDPTYQIQVGDFGVVDKETGRFEKEGNIYKHPDVVKLAAGHQPVADPEDSSIILTSMYTKESELPEPKVSVPGLAATSVKGRWEFSERRGGLLIIERPISSYIPPNVLLEHLVSVPVLKGKSLVTRIITSPAYCFYLSNAKEVVDIALVAKEPPPKAPEGAPGNDKEKTWWTQNTTGVLQAACDGTGSHSYTPLFILKRVRQKGLLRRDSPVPDPEGDDLWVNTLEPWEQLDDEGEEQPFEDTIFD